MSDPLVVASLTPTPALYDYADDTADALRKADRANQEERDGRNWSMMREADYVAAQRKHYLSRPLREITADEFHEALGALPPVAWEHRDGVERFIMSEAEAGTYHSQYAVCHGRYFTRTVDVRDCSTWITAGEIVQFVAPNGYAAAEEKRGAGEGRGGR